MSDLSDPRLSAADSAKTRGSILSGMRQSKEEGHRRQCQADFFTTYSPRLAAFFKRKGLEHHDAEDLASDLLKVLIERLSEFVYEPTQGLFRNYWHTCAQKALFQFWKKNARRRVANGVDLEKLLDGKELERQLKEDLFDLELLAEAKVHVQADVSERDWKIYIALTETPTSPLEVAKTIGMTTDAVDVVKHRVKHRIRAEIRRLESGNEE